MEAKALLVESPFRPEGDNLRRVSELMRRKDLLNSLPFRISLEEADEARPPEAPEAADETASPEVMAARGRVLEKLADSSPESV